MSLRSRTVLPRSAVALRETVDSVLDYTKISTNVHKTGTNTPTQSITSPYVSRRSCVLHPRSFRLSVTLLTRPFISVDLGIFLEEACDVIYSSHHTASFNSPSSEIGLLYSPLHSPPHPDMSPRPQVDCVVHVEPAAHVRGV